MSLNKLSDYIAANSSLPNTVLQELYRKTYLKTAYPQMLSGHVQGKFLEMVSHMIQPENILEIGTFTGYSAISLAQGLKKGGKIVTIEQNEEMEQLIREYIKKAGLNNDIKLIIGNALDILHQYKDTFDLVFLDADKNNYPNYYDPVKKLLRKGGFLLVDNVLWSEKVLDEAIQDTETKAIRKFTQLIHQDTDYEQLILPMRDGLLLARKIV